MTPRRFFRLAALLVCVWGYGSDGARAVDVPTDDGLAPSATWQEPAAAEVREALWAWLAERSAADMREYYRPPPLRQAEAVWPDQAQPSGAEMLDKLLAVAALVLREARELRDLTAAQPPLDPPEFAFLKDEKLQPLIRSNLRLAYGRWLCQQRLYDEAAEQLAGLTPEEVADPAALLFYQGVVHHWQLDREAALRALGRLLERRDEIPRRYASLATLMQADLLALEEDSLDHISRRMGDIQRRLELGKANARLIEVEDDVIAALDKLIKDLEEQAQQQAGSGGAAGGRIPLGPAQGGKPGSLKGRGDVTKKDVGNTSGWGELPPKERQEALQAIGKDFPSHYRDVIESYFRRLANQPAPK